jgi:hypothetical protein
MMYDVTMTRTQLMLEPWQMDALRSEAERKGESISALVREILSKHLTRKRAGRKRRLADLAGAFSGPPESGKDHDRHLYGHWKEVRR